VPELLAKTGGPLFKLPKALTGGIFDIDKLLQFTSVGALGGIFDMFNKGGGGGDTTAAGLAHLSELEAKYTAATLSSSKKLTAEELKQLKAKQLKAAIDKANLALNKGENVFNMEKIQLAAAEKNAAQQLGKVTSQAQLLQITNDLARVSLKQSILDLEDAIASKDVAAITAATNKLNADLKIVGALTNQKVELSKIEDILKALVPKDLINLANLDAAIAKLKIMTGATGTSTAAVTGTGTASGTPSLLSMLAAGSFVPVVGGGYSSTAGNYASRPVQASAMGGGGNTIIVNTGQSISSKDDIAREIRKIMREGAQRGAVPAAWNVA